MILVVIAAHFVVTSCAHRASSQVADQGTRVQFDEAMRSCQETVDMSLNVAGRRKDYEMLKQQITECGSTIKNLRVDYSTHQKPTKYLKAIWKGLRQVNHTRIMSLDLSRKDHTGTGYTKGVAVETRGMLYAQENGFEYLKVIIEKSPELRDLNLDNNFIGMDGMEDAANLGKLAEALENVQLSMLSLRNNHFDDHQLRDVFLRGQENLKELYVGGNRLTFESWTSNTAIRKLEVFDASSNQISDTGIEWLAGELKDVSVLRVAKNKFTQVGAESLLRLCNDFDSKVSELDISHNDLSGLQWKAWKWDAPDQLRKLKVGDASLTEPFDLKGRSTTSKDLFIDNVLDGLDNLEELDVMNISKLTD